MVKHIPGKKAEHATFLQDMSLGRHLRAQREKLTGSRLGLFDVPPGSVVLCVGLGEAGNELATEILVRVLRHHNIDARHISLADCASPPPGAKAESVSVVCVVSTSPAKEEKQSTLLLADVKQRLQNARRVLVQLPSPYDGGHLGHNQQQVNEENVDIARSYEATLNICLEHLHMEATSN